MDGGHQGNIAHWISSSELIWPHRDSSDRYRACVGLHQVCCLCVIALCMVFFVGYVMSLMFLPVLRTLNLYWNALSSAVQLWYESFCIALLYLVLSCLVIISWRSALFWKGNGGWVDLGQGEIRGWALVGGKGTEAVIEMYCWERICFCFIFKEREAKIPGVTVSWE